MSTLVRAARSEPREPRRPQPDATTLRGAGSPAALLGGWPARRRVRPTGRSNRENRGARNAQFRGFAGSISFETTPGAMGKREPQTILKTDERSIHLELGHSRENSSPNQWVGMNTGFSFRATCSRSRSRTTAWSSRTCPPHPILEGPRRRFRREARAGERHRQCSGG
jgi:hypothetical protein